MKIFEFKNAFAVAHKIESVVVKKSSSEEGGIGNDWTICILSEGGRILCIYYDTEEEAMQIYNTMKREIMELRNE